MLPDVVIVKTYSKSVNVDLGYCMDRLPSFLHGPAPLLAPEVFPPVGCTTS